MCGGKVGRTVVVVDDLRGVGHLVGGHGDDGGQLIGVEGGVGLELKTPVKRVRGPFTP